MVTTGSPTAPKEKPLLPDAFAGWVSAEKPKPVTDPAELDSANAAALKEYGCAGGMTAAYKRGDETLSVKALSFQDVSGAYGAYSFYRQNGWPKAEIGTGATSDKNRVLFWKGTTVVDATFSHVGPMSAGRDAGAGKGSADRRREIGRCRRRFWPTCRRDRWISRRRTLRRARRDMRERAACCRRSWWGSIATPRR